MYSFYILVLFNITIKLHVKKKYNECILFNLYLYIFKYKFMRI